MRIEFNLSYLRKWLYDGSILKKTRVGEKRNRRYTASHWNLGRIDSEKKSAFFLESASPSSESECDQPFLHVTFFVMMRT